MKRKSNFEDSKLSQSNSSEESERKENVEDILPKNELGSNYSFEESEYSKSNSMNMKNTDQLQKQSNRLRKESHNEQSRKDPSIYRNFKLSKKKGCDIIRV